MRAAVYAGTWDAVSNILQGMGMIRVRRSPELFKGEKPKRVGLTGEALERSLDAWQARHPDQVH